MSEFVEVGYFVYHVRKAWFSYVLTKNEFSNKPPDAAYLFVDLAVHNQDRQERTIPPFKLVDELGAEYGTSSRSWAADNAIGPLSSINPGVMKAGVIVFDVPKSRTYQLKLSGGFWTGGIALVQLDAMDR